LHVWALVTASLGGFAAAFACLGAFFRLGNVLILRGRCSSSRLSAGKATGLAPEESEGLQFDTLLPAAGDWECQPLHDAKTDGERVDP